MSKIYTKSGDQGTTHLIGGRAPKSDPIFILLGDLDELNAVLGMCYQTGSKIVKMQKNLIYLGSQLAKKSRDWKWDNSHVQELEKDIDEMTSIIPKLKTFILPHSKGAVYHLARAISRRAERNYWNIVGYTPTEVELRIGMFLNRLSDWLFTIARISARDLPYDKV